jgi:hypothetical protein
MPETYTDGSYLTQKGTALIAKLLASHGQLTFTKATVGSGTIPDGKTPETMTGLAHYEMDGMIAAIENPANGEASIVVQVLSLGLEQGFNATELALWATDPDEGEIVYTYLSLAQHPEWIRPEGDAVNKLATFTLITIVGSVQLVTAVINPDALARAADLARYALLGHSHQMSDIVGLSDTIGDITADIALLNDLVSGDMPGGIVFSADLLGLSNVAIHDGVYNQATRRIEAALA